MISGHTWSTVPVVRSLPAPGPYACGLTWDGRTLWYSDQDAGRIVAVEPADGAVVRSLDCALVRADLTWRDGLLGQIGGRPKRIVLVDPGSGQVVGQQPVHPPSGRLCGLEAGPAGMWMCLRAPAVVQLRDAETMTVQREIPVSGSPSGLTCAEGLVLYGEFEAELLHAVDPAAGRVVSSVPVEGNPTGMTWDGALVWYCDFRARRIKALRLDDVLAGAAG